MASLQVNKLAYTEDSASAKSLTKKWPTRITSLLNIAVEKDEKLLLEGRNSEEMASIIAFGNTNHGPNSFLWPRKENTGNR